jgi:hypothetical protein
MSDQNELESKHNPWNALQPSLNTIIEQFEDHLREYWESRIDVPLVESFLERMKDFAETILVDTDALVSAEAFAEPPDDFWQEWQEHFDGFEAMWADHRNKLEQAGVSPSLFSEFKKWVKDVAVEQATEPPSCDLPELRAVWEQLAIHLAYQTARMPDDAATRLLRLARYVISAKPGKATVQFLRRVSRCYVWGFDPECIVLCRGAIDTAFRDAVTDEACLKYEQPAAKYGFTLAQRIQTALRRGMITLEAEKAARYVNARATKTVHDDPGVTKDVLGTIQYTLLVLQQLSGAAPGKN